MLCARLLFSSISKGLEKRCRCLLFTDESLSLASFDVFRQRRREAGMVSKDDLWRRLDEYADQISTESSEHRPKLIFSEDVLQALAIAETHADASRVYRVTRPFVKQRMDGGTFRMLKHTTKPFSSLLMKLFHRTRHSDLAFHALTQTDDKTLEEFFSSNLQCYQIGMDLLFETRRYQQVLDIWSTYQKRRECSNGNVYPSLPAFPRSLQILVLASCYKLVLEYEAVIPYLNLDFVTCFQNTPESFQFAMKFIEQGYERQLGAGEHERQTQPLSFTRKALALAAALTANQNDVELAFEILSLLGHDVADSYTAPRSLKCLLLTKLGRWHELIAVFKRVLESDVPSAAYQDREISMECVKAAEAALESVANGEIREQLKRCCVLLRRGGHVVEATLEDLLCAPVQILPQLTTNGPLPVIDQRPSAVELDRTPNSDFGSSLITASNSMNEGKISKEGDDEQERNIWEASSVYDDDSSALASIEKFKESERKLRRLERRKRKILNTVGRWVREEGPLVVDDDRGER